MIKLLGLQPARYERWGRRSSCSAHGRDGAAWSGKAKKNTVSSGRPRGVGECVHLRRPGRRKKKEVGKQTKPTRAAGLGLREKFQQRDCGVGRRAVARLAIGVFRVCSHVCSGGPGPQVLHHVLLFRRLAPSLHPPQLLADARAELPRHAAPCLKPLLILRLVEGAQHGAGLSRPASTFAPRAFSSRLLLHFGLRLGASQRCQSGQAASGA